MKLKQYRGMTLIEVIMAFVLISLLVLVVSGFMTSSYVLSFRLDDLPNAYYGAQNEVEQELDKIRKLVSEKYRITNEMKNTPEDQITAEMRERLAQIERDLASYQPRTVSLFGGSTELYGFQKEFHTDANTFLHLYAGTPNMITIERPVPIIDSVSIKQPGQSPVNDVYHAVGQDIVSNVQYNEKNKKYHFRDLYQWYISVGDYHTAPYVNTPAHMQDGNSQLIPSYPGSFTLLTGETASNLRIKDEYRGKFVACLVTPVSTGGKMGRSVISNFIYISNLPQLAQGEYKMLIDPSITTYEYNANEEVKIDSISSRLSGRTALRTVGGQMPIVNLRGDVTASNGLGTSEGGLSRFISFKQSQTMKGNIHTSGSGTVFVVAKNWNSAAVDFIHSGGSTAGFVNNTNIYGTGSASGWNILVANIDSINDISVGKQNVDVAELVVVSSPSAEDTTAVVQYLSRKYSIDT